MNSPSGEKQARAACGMGSCVTAPPSTGTVKSCACRLVKTCRCEENRTSLPSGVKPSTRSAPGCQVSRKGGPHFHTDAAGQPANVAAIQVGHPEIVGINESDVLCGERRLGQELGVAN